MTDQFFLNEDVEVKNTGTNMEIKTKFGLLVKFDGDRKLLVVLTDNYKGQVITSEREGGGAKREVNERKRGDRERGEERERWKRETREVRLMEKERKRR